MTVWLPGGMVLVISTPGAATSGLTRPSRVGPRLEKEAARFCLSTAPTVMALAAAPGLETVFAPGPAFPAAATMTSPLSVAMSTPRLSASVPSEGLPPRLMHATRILSAFMLETVQSSPLRTMSLVVEPSVAKTFTFTNVASGATPL